MKIQYLFSEQLLNTSVSRKIAISTEQTVELRQSCFKKKNKKRKSYGKIFFEEKNEESTGVNKMRTGLKIGLN